jgi:hypothetical protein
LAELSKDIEFSIGIAAPVRIARRYAGKMGRRALPADGADMKGW